MAYTLKQLTMAWTAVHGAAPDAETISQLQLRTNPSFGDQAALAYILDSADGSTALAALSYQFFTGKSPTKEGLEFLTNSATNPNDLNDPYYARFNTENRYINFAANLGIVGEGASAFAGKYGAMSFGDYIASIYETIVGSRYATAAGLDPAKAIADITGRQAAILAMAQSSGMITPGMTQAQIDLAVKAAAAGYLLGEAIKADVGLYAAAANNFMLAVATGTATYNTDITTTYKPVPGSGSDGTGHSVTLPPPADVLPGAPPPPPPPPEPEEPGPQPLSFTLTNAADTFTGDTLNDTFTGTAVTLNAGDVLDGGAGDDTLTINAGLNGNYTPAAATLTSIETVNITNTLSGVYLDSTGWTDVTKLTVTDKESTQITAGAAQDVTITNTDQGGFTFIADGGHDVTVSIANSGGTVRVGTNAAPTGALVFTRASTGPGVLNIVAGTSADITLTATNAVNSTLSGGTAVIDGTALTTAIKVKGSQAITADANTAGHTGDNFTINSNAGAITTLEADGFNSVNFFGSAVTTLKIAHGALFSINNSAGPSAATTLTATVDAFIGDFSDQAVYQTLNINREGGASTLDMRMNALKTLTIGGSSALTLYIETNATNLETITVTGAGAFDAGDLTSFSNLTTLSAGTATGAITAKVDGGVTAVSTGSAADVLTVTGASISKSIATGDGDDTVTLSNAATIGATIDGGAGSHDVLKLSAAAAASAFATTYVTGFEVLDIGSLGSRVIDVSALGGASLIKAKDSGTITGLASGATVEIDGEANFTLGGDFTSVNDSLTLNYTGPAPSTGVFLGAVYSTAVETMNIHMDQTGWVPGAYAAMEWRDASATVVNLTGAGYMYVEALVSDNLSKVDASSFDGDVFFYQWGNLATTANVTVTGAAHHDNIFYFRGRGAVTYTGGDATDVVAVGGGANVIDVGTGDDVVFLRAVNSATRFTTVTGLGDPGDRLGLEFSGFTGAVTQVTGHTTLIDYLNASSASTTAGGADVVHWFELGADAYVVWDFSNSATYDENNGAVVKLVGMAGHFSGPLNTVATYETFGLRNYIGRMIEF